MDQHAHSILDQVLLLGIHALTTALKCFSQPLETLIDKVCIDGFPLICQHTTDAVVDLGQEVNHLSEQVQITRGPFLEEEPKHLDAS